MSKIVTLADTKNCSQTEALGTGEKCSTTGCCVASLTTTGRHVLIFSGSEATASMACKTVFASASLVHLS